MAGSGARRPCLERLDADWRRVRRVLDRARPIDKFKAVPKAEFRRRQEAVADAVAKAGVDVGFCFSDEHYCGDVPYLAGNTNVSLEQVTAAIGRGGCHVVAGLEGGYIAEQLAYRSGAFVHKAEMLKLADENYPVEAERMEDILDAAAGRKCLRVGLLTPRQVIPAALVEFFERTYGRENVIDCQTPYYRIKYEKSAIEMDLIRDANAVADAMMRAMLAVLKPGLLETQVAAWAHFVAKELGSEENGFKVMVGANEANRTMIGKALNRPIRKGDYVHLGVAPMRDGLCCCVRRSVIAVERERDVTEGQRYWFDLVEGGYRVGFDKYVEVARKGLPARLQEQALVDYFRAHSDEVSRRIGRRVQLEKQKPYTGTHNAGYTECQEFFGAITLDSHEPLGNRIVTMLDVALRGYGSRWHDIVIPGFDYLVVENTLGKFGKRVETFTDLPLRVQGLVGQAVPLR